MGHDGEGLLLGPGHRSPAGDDRAVVAHADPAAGHAEAVLVEDEVHDALGAHRALAGGVPAHENLVVPELHLATPEVAALIERRPTRHSHDVNRVAVLA